MRVGKNMTGKARNHFVASAFSLFYNVVFVFQEIPWLQKFKTLEKNEIISCMLHCYKIELNFLQKKFSKHLLHNIIVAYAYIVK